MQAIKVAKHFQDRIGKFGGKSKAKSDELVLRERADARFHRVNPEAHPGQARLGRQIWLQDKIEQTVPLGAVVVGKAPNGRGRPEP